MGLQVVELLTCAGFLLSATFLTTSIALGREVVMVTSDSLPLLLSCLTFSVRLYYAWQGHRPLPTHQASFLQTQKLRGGECVRSVGSGRWEGEGLIEQQ